MQRDLQAGSRLPACILLVRILFLELTLYFVFRFLLFNTPF
ncbi:conserved domain protein [Gardnerella vaginalis 315-A]|nr:conserved domain protein [Gardnerella vaginalis 315-A]